MKAIIQIPKGWRRLRRGAIIRKGDKFRFKDQWEESLNWVVGPNKVGNGTPSFYIRRIPRSKPVQSRKKAP